MSIYFYSPPLKIELKISTMEKYNIYNRSTLILYISKNECKYRREFEWNEFGEISLFGISKVMEDLSQNIFSEVDGSGSHFAVD